MLNLYKFSRRTKAALVLATDTLLVPVALWMAFGFRLGPFDPSTSTGLVDPLNWLDLTDALVIWLGSIAILINFRLYKIKLHAMDIDAIRRLALCSAAMTIFAGIASFFLQSGSPRSIPILFGASFFLLTVCTRIAALQFLGSLAQFGRHRTPVAIYGAGAAGIQLAASLKQALELEPVMFVDDNPSLRNVIIAGLRVKPPTSLKKAISDGRIQQILIAIPSLKSNRKEALLRELSTLGCEVKVIPSYVDLVSGKATVDTLVQVDPDDLLDREKVDLNTPEIARAYASRSVMVTGAGGSIGSELCHQILRCDPKRLVLFERSEPALYQIERELRVIAQEKEIDLQAVLGSVTDQQSVEAAFQDHHVEVVLHAAAYKHVPLLEVNEVEAARNNVLGTKILVDAALNSKLERFILVSTDKAVRPSNLMGATKSLAELVIFAAQSYSTETHFSFVRFGNVLGSSGSVVPLFAEQIAKGGPLTVTHPEVTRFFMTIPEAARLVLLAGAYAEGDDLFVLDMGQPVKILDIAKRMIELSGQSLRSLEDPEGDIAIKFIGLRPGEKLFEELLIADNTLLTTPHAKIMRAKTVGLSEQDIQVMIHSIREAIERRDNQTVRSIAATYIDGFSSDGYKSQVVPLPLERKNN